MARLERWGPVSVIGLFELNMDPAILASVLFSLVPSLPWSPVPTPTPFRTDSLLPSSPLLTSPQPSIGASSLRVLKIAPGLVALSLGAPALTCVVRDFFATGLLSADFLSSSILVLVLRLVPVLLWSNDDRLLWFLCSPLCPISVRSRYRLHRCLMVPVMLLRWNLVRFFVNRPSQYVAVTLPARSLLLLDPSFNGSETRTLSCVQLWLPSMCYSMCPVRLCWRCCLCSTL